MSALDIRPSILPELSGTDYTSAVYYCHMISLNKERSTDSDLVEFALQGDQRAWEGLVSRYQEPVFRLAYLKVGDPDDAADITQETFIRAYRALNKFDNARPLRPWLLRITTNLTRNRWRFLNRYWTALQSLGQTSQSGYPDRAHFDIQLGEYEPLWQAMDTLATPDREIIYLRYFLVLSVREAAETLGLAEGTVKSRTHRALNRLREALNEE